MQDFKYTLHVLCIDLAFLSGKHANIDNLQIGWNQRSFCLSVCLSFCLSVFLYPCLSIFELLDNWGSRDSGFQLIVSYFLILILLNHVAACRSSTKDAVRLWTGEFHEQFVKKIAKCQQLALKFITRVNKNLTFSSDTSSHWYILPPFQIQIYDIFILCFLFSGHALTNNLFSLAMLKLFYD
jgi:hypothetical protein